MVLANCTVKIAEHFISYMQLARLASVLLSCGSCAFTLKGCWNGVIQRCGLLRKVLAVVLGAAWPLCCPTANKHMRFRHPAVSKDPLNSGDCLVLRCSLPNSFSPFSLLYTNHLSFSLIAFLLICSLLFCWLTRLSEITIWTKIADSLSLSHMVLLHHFVIMSASPLWFPLHWGRV